MSSGLRLSRLKRPKRLDWIDTGCSPRRHRARNRRNGGDRDRHGEKSRRIFHYSGASKPSVDRPANLRHTFCGSIHRERARLAPPVRGAGSRLLPACQRLHDSSTRLTMTLPAGARLGHYEIAGPLGAGGMGEVYRAHDARLDRTVAVKVLVEADSLAQSRLLREARAAAALDHPNICPIYKVGEDGGRAFIVMPLLQGETLATRPWRSILNTR